MIRSAPSVAVGGAAATEPRSPSGSMRYVDRTR